MNRRNFFASGLGSMAAIMLGEGKVLAFTSKDEEIRAAFPRLEEETYLNAAAMMPLSTFVKPACGDTLNSSGWVIKTADSNMFGKCKHKSEPFSQI